MQKKLFLYFLLLLGFSCQLNSKKSINNTNYKEDSFKYSKFELKPGDILFQDSDCGPFCESIEKVTSGIEGAKFSHVGMIISKKNNQFVVIEAITKGVVETPLDVFLNRSFDENNNSKVAVGRIKYNHQHLIPKAIRFAKSKLGLNYDKEFNISNNKYYCSELIYDAFKYANNNNPLFKLQKMTYKDPETNSTFPIWKDYFQKLNIPIPEGELGLNPGGMSKSNYINIIHFYGKPHGYKGNIK